MLSFIYLVKRDCKVFLRDRSAVFFSLLSMFIVLILMVVFLGDMNVKTVTGILNEYGGTRDLEADLQNAGNLMNLWTLAGILSVNAVTVTLNVIGVMVKDADDQRIQSFYTTPVPKGMIGAAYVVSAILIGFFFCMVTFMAGEIFFFVKGYGLLPMQAILQTSVYIFVNVLVFALIMYLAGLFIKTASAWGGLATIVGTLVGFLGAIYIPLGGLPDKIAEFLAYLPILHGTALMRNVICKDAITETFGGMPEECIDIFKQQMGITIQINDKMVSETFQLLFLAVCGIITIVVIALRLRVLKVNDR